MNKEAGKVDNVLGKRGDILFEWSSGWVVGSRGHSDLGGNSSSHNTWPDIWERNCKLSGTSWEIDCLSTQSPLCIKELSVESFALLTWLLNYLLAPADGFAEKFTDVADIFQPSHVGFEQWLLLLFVKKIPACTASLEGDTVRSKSFCWMPQATDWNHILLCTFALLSNWWRHVNYR